MPSNFTMSNADLPRSPMPKSLAQVYVVMTTPHADGTVSVEVTDPVHGQRDVRPTAVADPSTDVVASLDPVRADHGAVLIVCEPKSEEPFNRREPTESKIAQQLNRLGREGNEIEARTVERRRARLRERFEVASNVELRDRLMSAGPATRADLDRIDGGAS